MAITLTYTFSANTTISSSQVNANFSTLATRALDKTGDTMTGDLKFTDASFDIGKTGATRPRDGFFSRNLVVGGALTVGTFPAGMVVQVVSATYSTLTSSSSSVYADTGLTASITPRSATNKILVLVSQAGCGKDTGNTFVQVKLLRNGSDVIIIAQAASTGSAATNVIGTQSCAYLDSPATTSAVTYKTQFASGNNVANAFVQFASTVSTITLVEVVA